MLNAVGLVQRPCHFVLNLIWGSLTLEIRVFQMAYLCQTSQKISLHITGGNEIISWPGVRIIQHLLNLTLCQLIQTPVVQKVDNVINAINLYPLDGAIGCLIPICRIVIHRVDSAIQCVDNLGQSDGLGWFKQLFAVPKLSVRLVTWVVWNLNWA